MFCTNCGNQVAENSLFCNNCGASLKTATTEPAVPDVVISPVPNITPAPIPPVHVSGSVETDSDINAEIPSVYGSNFSEPEQINKSDFASSVLPKPAPASMPTVSMSYEAPSAPEPETNTSSESYPSSDTVNQKRNAVKEKVFFGKGTLAFCILLIAALSVTAGIFAALYLKEIGFTLNLW